MYLSLIIWELYNLDVEGTGPNDLSARYPGKVAALEKQYHEWAERCPVVPAPH